LHFSAQSKIGVTQQTYDAFCSWESWPRKEFIHKDKPALNKSIVMEE